jgi:hypothetical protein
MEASSATRGSEKFSLTQLATWPARNFFNTRLGRICMGVLPSENGDGASMGMPQDMPAAPPFYLQV